MFAAAGWVVMWTLAISIYAISKLLIWAESSRRDVPAGLQAGFLLAWPGMDADRFFKRRSDRVPERGEWLRALVCCLGGIAVFWTLTPHIHPNWTLVRAWVGVTGYVLALHFGLFHLLSCSWRTFGIDAPLVMNTPIRSTSLGEFWGVRWNTAFRDLAHQVLFRPLARAFGPKLATIGGFLASGLIHDIVISIPAGGGYGLPTLYFLLQGIAILAERSAWGKNLGLRHGHRGRLFTLMFVVLPLPWLFHRPFVDAVFVPFMQSCGAW